MVDVSAREEVTFGPFTLRPGERLLTRDQVAVPLSGRALDILSALVASASRPLSKRELMGLVWPDVTVGEASLRLHVANLRKALGDGQNGVRYIETLSGRGYCFVAPVTRRVASPLISPTSGNLPRRPPLIGREEELADVVDLLGRERLVTIVGPGGVGKTRLAIACATMVENTYADGAWLIDLAPVVDPSLVVGSVATALGLGRGDAVLSAQLIATAIRDRRLLLVLDNCEHLVDAAAAVSEVLLQDAPDLTILATSQEGLRLDVEQVYRLDPLALPPPDARDVADYGAVALFSHRARAADRHFDLSASNVADVVEICRGLDGVPLSLEMAAGRLASLGVEGLRASLDARFSVLSTGLRTADARHRALRDTVTWSVGLLDETEALVFRRLGVFAGGFSLEAAMTVVAVGELDRWTVAQTLATLVDKSLVTVDRPEPARYRLLETLRLYAREALEGSGEWDRVAESHARHFCAVFSPCRAEWETTPDPAWRSAYLPELSNLRAALDWSLAGAERAELAIELTASAGFVWDAWGLVEEGGRFAARVAELLDERTPVALAAEVLRDVGLFRRHYDHNASHGFLQRSATMFHQLGDDANVAKVNLTLANLYLNIGRHVEAEAVLGGAREALSSGAHKRSLCQAMITLGVAAAFQEHFPEAVDDNRAMLDLAAQLGDPLLEHSVLMHLSLLAFARGESERAIALGRDFVLSARRLRQPRHVREALDNLIAYLLAADRLEEARPVAEEALLLLRDQAETGIIIRHLEKWALIAALEGRRREAARLIGWVDAALARVGGRRIVWGPKSYALILSLLGEVLADEERTELMMEGSRWSAAEAVAFTVDRIAPPAPSGA